MIRVAIYALASVTLAMASIVSAHGLAEELAPLAQHTPAGAGIYIELNDLAMHVDAFVGGEFAQRAREFPPLKEWRSSQGEEIDELSSQLQEALGVTPREAWRKLFGKQAIVAIWPRPTLDQQGEGLLLLRTSDPEFLERVIAVLRDSQSANDTWEVDRQVEHLGETYTVYKAPPRRTSKPIYLAAIGSTGVVTNSPTALDGVLRLLQSSVTVESLADTPIHAASRAAMADDAAVSVLIDPRAWEKLIENETAGRTLGRQEKAFQEFIAATDFWVTTYSFNDSQLRSDSYIRWRADDLPSEYKDVIVQLQGAADFMRHVPRDAIVAFAGRLDVAKWWWRTWSVRESVDLGIVAPLVQAVASAFGTHGGAFAIPQDTADPASMPWAWVVGLETAAAPEGSEQSAAEQLVRSLRAFATYFTSSVSAGTSAKITHNVADGLTITTISRFSERFPSHVVAFAATADYLWTASRPEAVLAAANVRPENSLATDPEFEALTSSRLDAAGWVVYARPARIAAEMDVHPEGAVALAMQSGLAEDEAIRSWNQLADLLRLTDHFLAQVQFEDDGARFSAVLSAQAAPQTSP